MAKAAITLDEQQVIRREQVAPDQDERGDLELLAEIRAKVRATQDTRLWHREAAEIGYQETIVDRGNS